MGRIGYSTWVQVVKIIGSCEEFGLQKGPLDTGVTQSVRASEGSLWQQCQGWIGESGALNSGSGPEVKDEGKGLGNSPEAKSARTSDQVVCEGEREQKSLNLTNEQVEVPLTEIRRIQTKGARG